MARTKQFRSALEAREPLVAEFPPDDKWPEGRQYQFPGDLPASEFLAFSDQFPKLDLGIADEWLTPFLRLTTGDQYERLVADSSVSEMMEVARWLYLHYVLGLEQDGESTGEGIALTMIYILDHWDLVDADFQRFYQLDPLDISLARFLRLLSGLPPESHLWAQAVKDNGGTDHTPVDDEVNPGLMEAIRGFTARRGDRLIGVSTDINEAQPK